MKVAKVVWATYHMYHGATIICIKRQTRSWLNNPQNVTFLFSKLWSNFDYFMVKGEKIPGSPGFFNACVPVRGSLGTRLHFLYYPFSSFESQAPQLGVAWERGYVFWTIFWGSFPSSIAWERGYHISYQMISLKAHIPYPIGSSPRYLQTPLPGGPSQSL